MSEAHPTEPRDAPIPPHGEEGHQAAHPPAEEDVVPSGKIVLVGVVALVVFTIGSLAAVYGMMAVRREVNPDGPIGLGSATGQAKIGIVEQRLFEQSNMGVAWKEQARQRLESTGWVDREKGIVHIPIERAMDLVAKGARP